MFVIDLTDMDPFFEKNLLQTRRQFFGDNGMRLGGVALASMMASRDVAQAGSPMHPGLPALPILPVRRRRSFICI